MLAEDKDHYVRADAAQCLGKLKIAEAEAELVLATTDPDAVVRAASAQALGMLGAQDAREALMRVKEGPSEVERVFAEEALQWLDELAGKGQKHEPSGQQAQ